MMSVERKGELKDRSNLVLIKFYNSTSTYLDCNSTSGYCAHIETNSGNHVFTEVATLYTASINSYTVVYAVLSVIGNL